MALDRALTEVEIVVMLIVSVIICLCIVLYDRYEAAFKRSNYSRIRARAVRSVNIAKVTRQIQLASEVRTGIQRRMHAIHAYVRREHSHQAAAIDRNSATLTMVKAVESLGYIPYIISPSNRESGMDGSRNYYSLADLKQDHKDDMITKRHIIVMTDVDYYLDMDEIISYGRPILCYTFQPTKVSGTVMNGYYTIEKDVVHFRVNGGKDVRHKIWDYNQDTVYTSNTIVDGTAAHVHAWKMAFGGSDTTDATVSTIDQFRMGEDSRRIVSIVPHTVAPMDIIKEMGGTRLRRMKYSVPETSYSPDATQKFNVLIHIDERNSLHEDEEETSAMKHRRIKRTVPTISVGIAGKLVEASMPLDAFESACEAHNLAKAKHLADTQRRTELSKTACPILHSYLINVATTDAFVTHSPGDIATPKHYFSSKKEDEANVWDQGKEYARAFAPGPLSCEAVYPTEIANNDSATVRGRITEPNAEAQRKQNNCFKSYAELQRYNKFAREFTKHITRGFEKKISPLSADEVDELQTKPMQRVRHRMNLMHLWDKFVVKAFQKREGYGNANYARNISTVPAMHTTRLSGFTYSVKKSILNFCDWYMPGKTPVEVSACVHELASNNTEVVETDYSKFDASVTEWIRLYVEFPIYLMTVHADHYDELHKLLYSELCPKAFTATAKYEPECSRLSGSPLTTDGNSICNAFVSYCAGRLAGLCVKDAYDQIGLVCGDDGLRNGNVTDALLMKTAHSVGFDLKILTRATRGKRVSFLSRVYPDAWTSPASIQAPKRALMKIHQTVNALDLSYAGQFKTDAYLITDANTPLLADWCKCYQRCAAPVDMTKAPTADLKDLPFWSNPEYVSNAWPQGEYENNIEVVADELGVTCGELIDHVNLLNSYNGPVAGMPQLQMPSEKPKIPVIMDGEIHAGPIINKPGPVKKDEAPQNIHNEPTIRNGCDEIARGDNVKRVSSRPGPRQDSKKVSRTKNRDPDLTPAWRQTLAGGDDCKRSEIACDGRRPKRAVRKDSRNNEKSRPVGGRTPGKKRQVAASFRGTSATTS